MTAEACLIFGWQPDYILSMPAVRFFAMLRAAKKIRFQTRSAYMAELCDVAAISIGGKDYYEAVRKEFYHKSQDTIELLNPNRALDPMAETTKMAVSAIFAVAQGVQ